MESEVDSLLELKTMSGIVADTTGGVFARMVYAKPAVETSCESVTERMPEYVLFSMAFNALMVSVMTPSTNDAVAPSSPEERLYVIGSPSASLMLNLSVPVANDFKVMALPSRAVRTGLELERVLTVISGESSEKTPRVFSTAMRKWYSVLKSSPEPVYETASPAEADSGEKLSFLTSEDGLAMSKDARDFLL